MRKFVFTVDSISGDGKVEFMVSAASLDAAMVFVKMVCPSGQFEKEVENN